MILAIDTATKWTGLALYSGAELVAEHGWRSINRQTVELAPAVDQMLMRAALHVSDLSAIAIALGPGSYTGLRIGLGFAKGLALPNQIPLIGVPTLDIVAAGQPPSEGVLATVAEAGRRRITSARYEWAKRWQPLEDPVNETWESLLRRLEPPAIVAGELSEQASRLLRAAGKGFSIAAPAARARRAGFLGEIAWHRLRRGEIDDAATLSPLYLRDP